MKDTMEVKFQYVYHGLSDRTLTFPLIDRMRFLSTLGYLRISPNEINPNADVTMTPFTLLFVDSITLPRQLEIPVPLALTIVATSPRPCHGQGGPRGRQAGRAGHHRRVGAALGSDPPDRPLARIDRGPELGAHQRREPPAKLSHQRRVACARASRLARASRP